MMCSLHWSSSGVRLAVHIGTDLLFRCASHSQHPCLFMCRQRVPQVLQRLRLSHGAITVDGTPRRLAVIVEGLATQQTSEESQARGAGLPEHLAFAL